MVQFDTDKNDPNSFIIGIITDAFNEIPPPKRGGRINPDNTPDKENKYCKACKKQTTVNRCQCHGNKDRCYPEHLRKEHRPEVKV